MATFGDNSLDVIVCKLSTPEFLPWGLVHAIPNTTDDDRALRITILKSYHHLVANFGHKHKSPVSSGMRSYHPRPMSVAILLPKVLNLNSAHFFRIIVFDDAGRHHSVPRLYFRRMRIGIVFPRRASEMIAVT